MALTKQKKQEVVNQVASLLETSKMTVIAKYAGTNVSSMQKLRRSASDSGTVVSVVKNRLVKQAILANDRLKESDTGALTGQLIYAFNAQDEAAPAQVLANFAKTNPTIEFVGAFATDGTFIGANDVKALASLPSKDALRAQLIGTLSAPLNGFANVLAGNVRGVLNILNARAESMGQ